MQYSWTTVWTILGQHSGKSMEETTSFKFRDLRTNRQGQGEAADFVPESPDSFMQAMPLVCFPEN